MRNLFVMMAIALSMTLLGGCNSITRVGGIAMAVNAEGEVLEEADVYSIVAENVAAPNWSQSVVRLPLGIDEFGIRHFKLMFSKPIGGPPITTGLLSGAANVVSSYVFGHELRPDTFTDNSTTTAEGGAGEGGEANAAADADAIAIEEFRPRGRGGNIAIHGDAGSNNGGGDDDDDDD